MFYKMKNILFVSALLLGVSFFFCEKSMALITLGEEAAKDDADAGLPTELDMFAEDDTSGSATAPATPKVPTIPPVVPKTGGIVPKTGAITPKTGVVPKTGGIVPKTGAPATEPVNDIKAGESEAPKSDTAFKITAGDLETPEDASLFTQMSDIERQTALLNLELRREKIKNEIEAVKNQRQQAAIQKQEKKEAEEKARIEWEKAQEQKVLQEEQKLRELDIQFEKLRQEQLLNSYKNEYLEDVQKWIAHDANLYKQIEDGKKRNQDILDESRDKFNHLKEITEVASKRVQEVIAAHKQQIEDLNSQIGVLKARIAAQEKEIELSRQNPFEDASGVVIAAGDSDSSVAVAMPVFMEEKLNDLYAVMEIRGQNGELIAKLKNQKGMTFYVKKGTALQSGHIVGEITSTYVKAEKDGIGDYLYFAAGGILPREQSPSLLDGSAVAPDQPQMVAPDPEPMRRTSTENAGATFVGSSGIPGIGAAMMVR